MPSEADRKYHREYMRRRMAAMSPEERKVLRAKYRETKIRCERRRYREARERCFAHYGRVCACCGESRYEFLAFDHVDGGGTQHRKQVGGRIVLWLIKNGFPEGFRVLCHNCNSAIAFHGMCPHQRERWAA